MYIGALGIGFSTVMATGNAAAPGTHFSPSTVTAVAVSKGIGTARAWATGSGFGRRVLISLALATLPAALSCSVPGWLTPACVLVLSN